MNWTCPTCARPTTVTSPNYKRVEENVICAVTKKDSGVHVVSTLIECPNQECKAQHFQVRVYHSEFDRHSHGGHPINIKPDFKRSVGIGGFTFLPSTAQPLSAYAPKSALQDYNEAYLISTLSPKASATLARRALQAMVRDFFNVKERTLHQEILATKDRCNPELYEAILGLKSIGNIGAHPEHDTSLIVEVDPGEPEALLDLIHLLDREWYVARAETRARIERVKSIDAAKKAATAGPAPAASP